MANEIEEDSIGNEPDLVQFPMQSEESLLDLIMVRCGELQLTLRVKAKIVSLSQQCLMVRI